MSTDGDSPIDHSGTDVRTVSVAEASSGHATFVDLDGPQIPPFPKYSAVSNSFGVPQIYCRSLLSSGNGFAPSNITGDVNRPDEHFSLGACIGDVGYVDDFGAFVYCFNVFCERDDEIQAINLPLDFKPFKAFLPAEDVKFTIDHHPAGTVIASEGIHTTRLSESPLKVRFTSSVREGAVLVLPAGASREDLVNPAQLYEYVQSNAMKWYQLLNQADDEKTSQTHRVPNGALRLVTGVDRAASWATATFPYRRIDSCPLRFQFSQGCIPAWKNAAGLTTLYRHNKESSADGNLGAVFLRFMSISVRQLSTSDAPSASNTTVPRYVLPTSNRPVRRSILRRFRKPTPISPCPPELMFDPSIILLQLLQKMDETAPVAVVIDSLWRQELHHQLIHSEFIALLRRIIKHNHVQNIDGLATFATRSPDNIPTSSPGFWSRFIPCVPKADTDTPHATSVKEILQIISS